VSNEALRPRWQHLAPAVQQPLLDVLTHMLQQHLLVPMASGAGEVANESC
jgi:hypothetical protein